MKVMSLCVVSKLEQSGDQDKLEEAEEPRKIECCLLSAYG